MTECLPWQLEAWQRLMRSRAAGRLPHAMLLTGPTGIGKLHFAQALAQSLLCQSPAESGFACGACRDFRLFSVGNHPDLFNGQPGEPQAGIKIEQIRSLAEFCIRTSSSGRGRVGLVAPAERMNSHAANALLKTLEEPPPGIVLLLLSSQPSQIPATLRSRCQPLKLVYPPKVQAVQWLREQEVADPELLLTLAGGAPLQAQQLAQQQALTTRRALFDIYRGVVEQRLSEAAAAEQWLRQDTELGLEWLLGWHMDLIRLNMSTEVDLSHPDLAQELRDLADVVSLSECFRRYHALLQIRQQLKMQRNAPMLMEAFFSTCQTVNQTIGVATG